MDGVIGDTAQIDSTPHCARCWSMKGSITSLGGEAPPGQKRGLLLGDLIGAAQLDDFAMQPLELRAPVRRQAGPLAAIALGAADLTCQVIFGPPEA